MGVEKMLKLHVSFSLDLFHTKLIFLHARPLFN
jgi:hypothetical protein